MRTKTLIFKLIHMMMKITKTRLITDKNRLCKIFCNFTLFVCFSFCLLVKLIPVTKFNLSGGILVLQLKRFLALLIQQICRVGQLVRQILQPNNRCSPSRSSFSSKWNSFFGFVKFNGKWI